MEAADARDEAGLAGIEPGQLHGSFDRVGAVADEERLLEVSGCELPEQLRERAAQRIEQFL
jgi:hypothetical protein